jgi:hypothetical protein
MDANYSKRKEITMSISKLPTLGHSVGLGEISDQSHINDTAAVVGPICVAIAVDPQLPVMIVDLR